MFLPTQPKIHSAGQWLKVTTVVPRDSKSLINFLAELPLVIRCMICAESALPPKADMWGATRDVRFGPKADIGTTTGVVMQPLAAKSA